MQRPASIDRDQAAGHDVFAANTSTDRTGAGRHACPGSSTGRFGYRQP